MRLKIRHSTTYRYHEPVSYGLLQVRLTPKDSKNQNTLDWTIEAAGGAEMVQFRDHLNNQVTLLHIEEGASEVEIVAHGEVDTIDTAGIVENHRGFAPLWFFKKSSALTRLGKETRQLARQLDGDADTITRLHTLSSAIRDRVTYETGSTYAETTAEEALQGGAGVCQDHAHVFISCARQIGVPARYVSGYLMMDDRIDQDATHAWAEAHVEGLGWVGFDVSNGISPDERYVRVATGLDYAEAAPVTGMRYGEGDEKMIVSLQVQQ
ncbi:MAG: transglutaminase family protein [Pseudomonadota bacterium]